MKRQEQQHLKEVTTDNLLKHETSILKFKQLCNPKQDKYKENYI